MYYAFLISLVLNSNINHELFPDRIRAHGLIGTEPQSELITEYKISSYWDRREMSGAISYSLELYSIIGTHFYAKKFLKTLKIDQIEYISYRRKDFC